MNPITESNIDFAKRGIELLAPAAAKNMPFKWVLEDNLELVDSNLGLHRRQK